MSNEITEKIGEPVDGTSSQSSVNLGDRPTFREHVRLAALSRSKENDIDSNGSEPREGATEPSIFEKSGVDQVELVNARRALRVAGWASVFFLITTDILGPFNAPFAFSQVGYVPGTVLYIVMGAVACYTGFLVNKLFCKLDSHEYPIRTYAELGGRIFGKWFKYLCTVLETLQLIFFVAQICLQNAQSVEQIAANRKFCFSVAIIIWIVVGIILGQIRTLKNYGWLANCAVWLNLTVIFVSMGFIAHSPPNYESARAALGVEPGPIVKSAFVSLPLFAKINGIMNMVFAYGGAMIFPEIMAEMRRPMDFWKGMVCAQLLITTVYLLYGLFVYSFQGQFTLPLAFQGVSKLAWQDVGNVLSVVIGIIVAGLYGNIGIKVAYYQIVEEWFKGPPLTSRRGKFMWPLVVVLYWAIAFVIASAIPQVQTIAGLIAAICIMQFTYTFPPLLWLGYQAQVKDGEDNEPSRWKVLLNGKGIFNVILFLGSAAMACLGMYGSGTAIRETFKHAAATSFGCTSPV